MKKFTLSYLVDSDSNKSANSLANISNSNIEMDLPKITELNIIIKDLNKQTTLKVIGDAIILDIKKKLLFTLGDLLTDSQNMGLYLPDEPSRKGKFLEEERLLSEYISGKTIISLEFIYKRRTIPPFHMSPTLLSKLSKNFIKTFFRYVSRGECQKVEKLLSKGFDPNIHCPKTGETPLTIAVTRSKPYEMISTLISGGAHRDFYSLAGYTPLHKAVTVGNFEGVKTLLDFGQSPNCLDKYGLTPLYYNILYDPDTKICHSLLYEHSKIGISDKDGLQEIHQATRLNRVEQINLLLMYGADVNARCKRPKETVKNNLTLSIRPQSVDGDTPLHVAANHNQRAAVLRLLSWGADPTLVNAENMTPIQVAQNNGNLELADLIKLFRGRKESSDIFLPTPTYNPHRRVRQPPPNSYITEPSILQNYTPNGINEIHLNDQQLNSTNNNTNDLLRDSNKDSTNFNITEKSATCTCSYTTTSSTRPIDSKPIQRAVSLCELIQSNPSDTATGSTTKWNGAWDLGPNGFYSPCYDVNAASNQIYCEMPRYENGTNLAGTLTRPVKLKQKCKDMSISKSRTDIFTSNLHCQQQQQQPQRHQCPKMLGTEYKNPSKERTISRGQQTDVLYDFITREDKGFQREGSQTDSGISNSSCRPITFGSLSRTHNNKIHHDQSDKYQDGALSSYDSFGQGNKKDSTNFQSTQFSKDLPSNDNKSYMNKLNQQTNNVKSVHVNICDSRHLRRSSTLHEHLDRKRSTNSKDNIRTVILERYAYSSNGIDKNERSSFGLSIRTVKNSSVIAEFTPTTNKPSLQTVKRVVPDSPAEKAGVKVGDFVLKINGADVTKASLNQVVDLLSSSSGDKVSLTLLSPKCITPYVLNNNSDSIHHVNGENDGDGCAEHYVITRKSTDGNSINLINKMILPTQSVKCNQTVRSTKLARHSTISPISSERSSDRTYISSLNENSCLTDEGVYCQSLCASSNVSGRSSSSSRLITNSNPVQQSSMQNNKQTFDASTHRVRFQGLPRSQTTNGISDICSDKSGNSMINSLYFPRHPRFQRVGSNESQNSSYSQTNYIQTPRQQNIDLHIVDERLHKHFSSDYPASVTRGISSKQSPLLRSYFTPEQQNLSIITGKPSHLIRRPISLNPETRKKSTTYLSDNESPSTIQALLTTTTTTETINNTTTRLSMRNESRLSIRGNSPTNSEFLLPPPAEFSN